MVDIVGVLRDLFVAFRAFVILLLQQTLQGSTGKILPLGRQQCLEELGIEHTAAFTIVGHLHAERPFEDSCHAEVHIGLALNPCVLWQEQTEGVGHADDPNGGCVLFAVLAIPLLTHVDIERVHYFGWICVLAVEGDVVLPQLFLCCLDIASLEGLGFLLVDGLRDFSQLIPIDVDKLSTLTIV